MKRFGLLILAAAFLVASCSSPSVPRLPKEEDDSLGKDTTNVGFLMPTLEGRSSPA